MAWVYLAVGHGGYWRTSQWLPSATSWSPLGEPPRWPGVVAVIPARNESDRIAATVQAAAGLPGVDVVVVVDDASTDGTAAAAQDAGASVMRHARNRGKAAAMETGAEAVRLLGQPLTARSGTRPPRTPRRPSAS